MSIKEELEKMGNPSNEITAGWLAEFFGKMKPEDKFHSIVNMEDDYMIIWRKK